MNVKDLIKILEAAPGDAEVTFADRQFDNLVLPMEIDDVKSIEIFKDEYDRYIVDAEKGDQSVVRFGRVR